VLSFSVQGGDLPPDLRWLGGAVVEVLRDPAVVFSEKPPERWDELQHLSALGDAGPEAEEKMLGVALALLEKQPHDQALL